MSKPKAWNAPAIFLTCIGPLLATDVLRTLIMYHYSADHGLWTLFLGLMVGFSVLFSICSFAVARVLNCGDTLAALRFHAILAGVLVAHTLAFYTVEPNWLLVNSGMRSLALLQRVVHSDWAILIIYLAAFVLWLGRSINSFRRSPDEK